jgi:hypothetical protein
MKDGTFPDNDRAVMFRGEFLTSKTWCCRFISWRSRRFSYIDCSRTRFSDMGDPDRWLSRSREAELRRLSAGLNRVVPSKGSSLIKLLI